MDMKYSFGQGSLYSSGYLWSGTVAVPAPKG
jgi:hypothetical protein